MSARSDAEIAETLVEHMQFTKAPPGLRRLKVNYHSIGAEVAELRDIGEFDETQVDWRVGFADLCVNDGSDRWPWPGLDARASRFREVSPQEARRTTSRGIAMPSGRWIEKPVKVFLPRMFVHESAGWMRGTLIEHDRCVLGRRGQQWFSAVEGSRIDDMAGDILRGYWQSTVAQSLAHRYQWIVGFQCEEGPTVEFATDAVGARQAFRLRDVDPGKSRRSALLHWVAAHRRHDDSEEARQFVSQHLRGRVAFSWNGLRCEIRASAFDREREIARKAAR